MTRESSRDGPLLVWARCRGHKGTGLDDNNQNHESFSIDCNVHDNPLIEPGEMQYYAKIEGTDRYLQIMILSLVISKGSILEWIAF